MRQPLKLRRLSLAMESKYWNPAHEQHRDYQRSGNQSLAISIPTRPISPTTRWFKIDLQLDLLTNCQKMQKPITNYWSVKMTHGATSANWTPERRKQQSKSIQKWRPWEKSTGPKSDAGKRRSAMRSLKTGLTSAAVIEARKTVMGLRRLEVELLDKL